jgi:peptidoglycan hydrolase FlgJ
MKNRINQSINRFAYDFSSISQLKRNAISGTSDSIKQVADQFETLFINMMMQSMRKTIPNGGLFNQSAMQLFTSMFDQQIAQQTAGKGFGLANVIAKQLNNQPNTSANINAQPQTNNNQPNMRLAQSLFSDNQSNLSPAALGQMLYQQQKANNLTKANINALSQQTPLNDLDKDPITQFITEWFEPAQKASKASGIPYEVIIAQAALETGWGKKQIKTTDNQPSHNYFGIKATSSWKGHSTRLTTQEFLNNNMIKIKDDFRVYRNKQHALTDYLDLLTKNPRYKAVVNAPDARTAAKALQDAQYATDPNYSDKLIQIISRIEQIAPQQPANPTKGIRRIAFN